MPRHSSGTFFQRLAAFDEFFEPVHREIVAWLNMARGGKVADIGCGAGGMARLFAEAVGEEGAVIALETSDERADALRALLQLTPEFPRIQLSKGELPALALAENEYDLTWCSRVIHHLADPVVGIRELGRITKAGGRVVLREGGFGPRFLPYDVGIGAPGIEDRLRVAQNVWFDRMHAQNEHGTSYPHGWLGALRAAGLNNVTAKTFLYELTPPFSGAQVSYLRGWLNDCATNEEYPLAEEDREALRQLSDETSQHDAFRRDDLHLLYAASIYLGDKSD